MKIQLGTQIKAWVRGLHQGALNSLPVPVVRFRAPDVLKGVIPDGDKLAQDNAMSDVYLYANTAPDCGYGAFIGYPALAELTQRPEYRMLTEKTAAAMVRKWVKLKSKAEGDKGDKIAKIEARMVALKVRELFFAAAVHDGFFGRAQLFIDMGEQSGKTLEVPLFRDGAVIKGKLRKFKLIEAMYTYPNAYNASNPLADDYYNPSSWFVMSQKVASSRLLLFIGRPVPDMLKPAYNFGGISMSQLAMPYVDNWLKARSSVGKLLRNYSTSGVATDLSTVLAGDCGDDLMARADLFSAMRDNQGLLITDKETEEFFQHNVPLTTVDKLQAQAQEQMASVGSMPLVVLTGITPAGLNASSDGEIRVWYDTVADRQRTLFGDNLTEVIKLIQFDEFGEIDPDITYDFIPLHEQSEEELAKNRKSDAEAANLYVTMQAVSPEEVRQKLIQDEHSNFNSLAAQISQDEPE